MPINAVAGTDGCFFFAIPTELFTRFGISESTTKNVIMSAAIQETRESKRNAEEIMSLPGVVVAMNSLAPNQLYLLHIVDTGDILSNDMLSVIDTNTKEILSSVKLPCPADNLGITTDGVIHVWNRGFVAYSLDAGRTWIQFPRSGDSSH